MPKEKTARHRRDAGPETGNGGDPMGPARQPTGSMAGPLFVKCSRPEVTYRGERIVNRPVNISLCKSVSKDRVKWYPDNKGLPSMRLHGCDTEWVYPYEEERDRDYELVAGNGFSKGL